MMDETASQVDESTQEDRKPPKRTVYSLKKSDIYLLEDCLVQQNTDGDEVARYKLDDISSLLAVRRLSYISLSILLFGLGLVALGYFVVEPSDWAWLTYGLGGLVAVFGAIIIQADTLVVEAGGQEFKYTVQEDFEELAGFAYSVNQYIKDQQK